MKMMTLLALLALVGGARAAAPSEISVKIEPDSREYVIGERVRAVVSVENSSAVGIVVTNGWDSLIVELFRASDMNACDAVNDKPFTASFALKSSEGLKLETFLGDHYALNAESRYLARAVLVHRGIRYESSLAGFDMVPGMKIGGAMQMFSHRPGLTRMFELAYWSRGQREHLFLKAHDENGRVWRTTDLGILLRVTPPKISVMPDGQVIVLHRSTQDEFVRSVFWSLPNVLDYRSQEPMTDPDVAGVERVKELYMEAGGVTPVKKAWWKFW